MIRIIENSIRNSKYLKNYKVLGSINVSILTQIREFAKPVEKPAKVFNFLFVYAS